MSLTKLRVDAQIYIFALYTGPKFTQPTFTQNPNLHNTKFTPDPNLHDPRFTPPQIYKTQIYTSPDLHSHNYTQSPNLHSPKFTQSQIYTVPKSQHGPVSGSNVARGSSVFYLTRGDKVTPLYVSWDHYNSDECRTHSWTRGSSVASGSLRPFGPVSGSNVARGSSVLYLTRGDNVTPLYTLWDNCCMRFEDTQFECLSNFHQNWCRVG